MPIRTKALVLLMIFWGWARATAIVNPYKLCLLSKVSKATLHSKQDLWYVDIAPAFIRPPAMVSQETNADTNLVPAIIEARRAVCGLQFQRVCETEDSRFISRAQGCAEPAGDPGIDAEGFERAAEHEGACRHWNLGLIVPLGHFSLSLQPIGET